MAMTMKRAVQRRALSYKPPARDIKFVFDEVLNFQSHYEKDLPEHVKEECTPEFVDDVLEASTQMSEQLLEIYQSGDEGAVWKDGKVTTPKGFKEAFDAYKEGGWGALTYPSEYGGMNLPLSVSLIKNEICATANWSWFMYPGLTMGACNTILLHCSEELKQRYLPKLVDLTWTGTMCLTEPHCGTDLGQMRTKAVPNPDGSNSYLLTGQKIFISAGEHDMAENIVHIVLAKLPGAPEGTKGISLFLVPKYVSKEDESLDTSKQNMYCSAIEKKMGIHGCVTSQLDFEDSVGYLIGEPHDGLRQMFTFMNTARIGTGIQGLSHMELAYQNAVHYTHDRISLRALSGKKDKDKVADTIIHHGDIRRTLMTCKAILEGSRCLLYDVAKFGDKIHYAELAGDHELVKKLDDEMGFLTPVAKGFVTEWGCQVANMSMDTFGGHGYIKAHGMEQIVRDARIATLYEGTTGIQALDLAGRKMMLDKLRLFNKWNKKVGAYAWSQIGSGTFRSEALKLYKLTWQWKFDVYKYAMGATKNRDFVGTGSHDNLFNTGYILLAYYWLMMGTTAEKKLAAGGLSNADKIFYESKIATAKFYYSHVLLRQEFHRRAINVPAENFYKIEKGNFAFY
eukprot:TRINITY_DN1627_c0_g1_i1.p1 TRINITY_DN1627_c0_g1~~TRINITY_DN1627_c0_g1_i1.p1  ORF type:complete len:623 (+),score=315.18 TRINITY_DN1627_c0_g1_i1:64-1932(+)